MSDFASAELIAERLAPVADYALQPLPYAFENLNSLASLLDGGLYDVTAFYSRRREDITDAESQELSEFNARAYDLAKQAGGLILYYQGALLERDSANSVPALELDFTPDCLSFCIWRSLKAAKSGAGIAEHQAAARRTRDWYERFAIKKYTARKQNESVLLEEVTHQA